MTSFGDVRDVIASMPHVTHGHATLGGSKKEGAPYNLYEPRAWFVRYVATKIKHERRPMRVFEYGALLGYALAAMGQAVRDRGLDPILGWCDNESIEAGSNTKCIENMQSLGHVGFHVYTDRRETPAFLRADVVAVDGDHSYEATMDDLAYAMLLDPTIVFVDDIIDSHPGTRQASLEVSHLFKEHFRVPTVNGLAVLSKVAVRNRFARAGWITEDLRF